MTDESMYDLNGRRADVLVICRAGSTCTPTRLDITMVEPEFAEKEKDEDILYQLTQDRRTKRYGLHIDTSTIKGKMRWGCWRETPHATLFPYRGATDEEAKDISPIKVDDNYMERD